jgi:Zn-dependent M28 family amino/carboxypeptidase
VVDAHYDHLGIGVPVGGDSIYNGADDDASGTVSVLSVAKALASGPHPKRSILFVLTTGEEEGLLGTNWLLAHFPLPFDSVVANLETEMIGRPDSLAGGPGKAWLTGYDRSTMGAMLARAHIAVVADPRPSQHFYERSDNIAFAERGIPAHTLSSFDLHADYHQPSDDLSRIDFAHMTAVINSAVRAVQLLANGPLPVWNPGGRPVPQTH